MERPPHVRDLRIRTEDQAGRVDQKKTGTRHRDRAEAPVDAGRASSRYPSNDVDDIARAEKLRCVSCSDVKRAETLEQVVTRDLSERRVDLIEAWADRVDRFADSKRTIGCDLSRHGPERP